LYRREYNLRCLNKLLCVTKPVEFLRDCDQMFSERTRRNKLLTATEGKAFTKPCELRYQYAVFVSSVIKGILFWYQRSCATWLFCIANDFLYLQAEELFFLSYGRPNSGGKCFFLAMLITFVSFHNFYDGSMEHGAWRMPRSPS